MEQLNWGVINFDVENTDYDYVNAPYTGSTVPGQSTVFHEPNTFNSTFIPTDDVTIGGGGTLLVDGSTVTHQYFYKGGYNGAGFCGLTPGIVYTFTYYIRSTTALVTGPTTQADVRIDFSNASNITLLTGSTIAPLPAAGWLQVSYSFEATAPCVDVNLWNFNTNAVGNDFALDEFSLFREKRPFSVTYSLSKANCNASTSLFCYSFGGNLSSIVHTLVGPSYNSYNLAGTFVGLLPGNYTLTSTDADGTVVTNAVTVGPNTSPLTISPDVTICVGESTALNVSGSSSGYYWSSAPYDSSFTDTNNPSPTVSPTVSTTYTAVSYDNTSSGNLIYNGDFSMGHAGFTSSHDYYPTNFENASSAYGVVSDPSAWGNFPNCGDHTTGTGNMLVVNGMHNYYYGGGNSVWAQTLPVEMTTNYIFSFWVQSLTDVFPASIVVHVNGSAYNVSPYMAPSTATCGNWAQYSFNYYSWYIPAVHISINNTNISFEGNDFAIDDIVFEAANSCMSNSITVTVAPSSTVLITAASTVSDTITFDWDALPSVTGYAISYNINNGTSINGGTVTATDFTVNGLSAGDAVTIIVAPIGTGCFAPATYTANSFSPCEIPQATITQQPNCITPVGTITVNAPLGNNFEYSLDGTTFQSGPIFSNLPFGNYTIVLKNTTSGCQGSGTTLYLSQSGLQQPDITALDAVQNCQVILTASSTTPNISLVWNGPTLSANSTNPAVTTTSGTYTATATDLLSGCTKDFVLVVTAPAAVAVPTAVIVSPTCMNEIGSINITAPLGNDYAYSHDGNNYQSGVDFLNLAPGFYPVSVKNIVTGCISTPLLVDLNLPVLQPPVPSTASISLCQNSIANALVASALPGAVLNWYGLNATGGTASGTPPVPDTTVVGTFIYYCSQTIGFCESERIGIPVTVFAAALVPDFEDLEYCLDSVIPSLSTISPNGINGSWQPNVLSNTTSGSYTFTPAPNECARMQTITVTILQPVSLEFNWFVNADFSEYQTVTIQPLVNGDSLYQLDSGAPQSSPVFENVAPGIHSITILDPDGCSRPITKKDVLVLDYPRFFTPNNDSYNDTWSIRGLFQHHNASVEIFDRYGKLLKFLNLKNAEVWDGTYNGVPMPSTDYWFTVRYSTFGIGKTFSNHFSLKR